MSSSHFPEELSPFPSFDYIPLSEPREDSHKMKSGKHIDNGLCTLVKTLFNPQLVTPLTTIGWLWYLRHTKRFQIQSQYKMKRNKKEKENFNSQIQKDIKKIRKKYRHLKEENLKALIKEYQTNPQQMRPKLKLDTSACSIL